MRTDPASPVRIPAGLADLRDRYDLILCDVWGVLHNGVEVHAAAGAALREFRAAGGRVVLVSNAPRPGPWVLAMLGRMGVDGAAYDGIVTSGDLAREAVLARPGERVHHMGPERDLPIYDGLGVTFASVEDADYVVCSGLVDDDVETPEDYRERLERMRARSLWMLCANPDLVVERGDRLIPCAGALGQLYETLGGEVHYPGKPHRPVYEAALREGSRLAGRELTKDRVLAVGDALRTDVAGAAGFGIDSLLVARGIHAKELGLDEGELEAERLERWLAGQALRPTYAIDILR